MNILLELLVKVITFLFIPKGKVELNAEEKQMPQKPIEEPVKEVAKEIETPVEVVKKGTPIDPILKWFKDNNVVENVNQYRINIVGVRTSYKVTNKYDDLFYIWRYNDKNELEYMVIDGTTKAGHHYTINPLNTEGVAIIKANKHYKDVYRKGLHKGKPALKQHGIFEVYRDNNRNTVFETVNLRTAAPSACINLHYSSNSNYDFKTIDRWSASCQVVEKQSDWDKFWDWVEKDFSMYHKLFSYTLIDIDRLQ